MQSREKNKKDNGRISRLESVAAEILSQIPQLEKKIRLARRPFIIELSGTPKSGKSTVASRLEMFLRRNGLRVRTLVERASTSPLRKKDHMHFNVWTACTTLAQMLEALESDIQVVIIDRGLFDALCWMHWLQKTNRLDPEEKKTIEDFILLKRWSSLIDIVFVLTVTPDKALEREFAGQLTKRKGSIMNDITLEQINDSIESTINEQGDLFKCLITKDTSSMETIDTIVEITGATLKHFGEFLQEEIMVLPKTFLSKRNIVGGFVSEPDVIEEALQNALIECRFIKRPRAEGDVNYVQPTPIAYFQYEGKYLLLRRKEEKTKSRMHEKYVVWAGGHIRQQDMEGDDPIKECLLREITEELYIVNLPEPELVGLVYDTSSIFSSQHIGIVYKFVLEDSDLALSIDQREFKETKGKSVSGTFVSVEELESYFYKMENWSKMILVSHLKLFEKPLPQQQIMLF